MTFLCRFCFTYIDLERARSFSYIRTVLYNDRRVLFRKRNKGRRVLVDKKRKYSKSKPYCCLSRVSGRVSHLNRWIFESTRELLHRIQWNRIIFREQTLTILFSGWQGVRSSRCWLVTCFLGHPICKSFPLYFLFPVFSFGILHPPLFSFPIASFALFKHSNPMLKEHPA